MQSEKTSNRWTLYEKTSVSKHLTGMNGKNGLSNVLVTGWSKIYGKE